MVAVLIEMTMKINNDLEIIFKIIYMMYKEIKIFYRNIEVSLK